MKNSFESRLKELRTEFGLAQDKLAEKINYSKAIVSEWERGIKIPSATAIVTLATFFNVTTDYLLGRENFEGNIITVSPGLTDEEQRLIDYYRALPPELRSGVMTYTRTFYELNNKGKINTAKG